MKRPRPYIPLSVRLHVATRQMIADGMLSMAGTYYDQHWNDRKILQEMLYSLFGSGIKIHLDHDPPLRARAFNPRTGKYKPDANDPQYLVYRSKENHRVKTFVRGEHGQYSDTILIARERKREKKKAGLKPAYHWPKRKIRNRKNAVLSGKIR